MRERPISKDEAESVFTSTDEEAKADAIVDLAFNEADWKWVQNWCIRLVESDESVRGAALICFAHIARIHRQLELEKVIPVLCRWRSDPEVGGIAADALADIEKFLKRQ